MEVATSRVMVAEVIHPHQITLLLIPVVAVLLVEEAQAEQAEVLVVLLVLVAAQVR